MKVTDTHIYFWNGIYSNWHPAPHVDRTTGNTFQNTEQAFMWEKAMIFGDEEMAKRVLETPDPREVKKLGRQVKGFEEEAWDKVKVALMFQVNMNKFTQIEEFGKELIASGDKVIVEASPYDKVWGVGLLEDDPLILDEANWQGQNLLGEALMQVRTILRENV